MWQSISNSPNACRAYVKQTPSHIPCMDATYTLMMTDCIPLFILGLHLDHNTHLSFPNMLSTEAHSPIFTFFNIISHSSSSSLSSSSPSQGSTRSPMIPAPKESIRMFSPSYYAACSAGGIFSCGLTHMAVTLLDLVKCNMQIDPVKYKNITSGFGVLLKEQGAKGFFRGWVPTLLGYIAQGACKFGFYEFFKKYYS